MPGLRGGRPGGLREIRVNGSTVHPNGRYTLAPGDRLTTFEAGGGGFGDPRKRSADALRHDLEQGFVTAARATTDYGA